MGGLWNYTPLKEPGLPAEFPIPQTDPLFGSDIATKEPSNNRSELLTPLYDRLEANIPRGLVGYSDQDWPSECPLFPRHAEILEYVEKYSKEIKDLIHLETRVVNVQPIDDDRWAVTTQPIAPARQGDSSKHIETFDAVIVASGHYDVPYIPDVPGIASWHAAHPGRISHSKFYRRSEQYAGRKVLVVGNAASGSDIGAQIAEACALPLIFSTRSPSYLFAEDPDRYLMRPAIAEYLPATRGVRFEDGMAEDDIDAILYCTGYLYSYPFLQHAHGGVAAPNAGLITTGERVQNLYQHMFYRPRPTLVFLGLPQKVIPLPFVEAQSAVVAKVLSGQITLPDEAEMAAWEVDRIAERGAGRAFHLFKFPEDADHINFLHDWAQGVARDGLAAGKVPPHWGPRQYWMRELFPKIRQAYLSLGQERFQKKTLEEIGFDFEKRAPVEASV